MDLLSPLAQIVKIGRWPRIREFKIGIFYRSSEWFISRKLSFVIMKIFYIQTIGLGLSRGGINWRQMQKYEYD